MVFNLEIFKWLIYPSRAEKWYWKVTWPDSKLICLYKAWSIQSVMASSNGKLGQTNKEVSRTNFWFKLWLESISDQPWTWTYLQLIILMFSVNSRSSVSDAKMDHRQYCHHYPARVFISWVLVTLTPSYMNLKSKLCMLKNEIKCKVLWCQDSDNNRTLLTLRASIILLCSRQPFNIPHILNTHTSLTPLPVTGGGNDDYTCTYTNVGGLLGNVGSIRSIDVLNRCILYTYTIHL